MNTLPGAFAALALALAATGSVALATEPVSPPDGKTLPSAIGYQPQDELERGLWLQVDEAERQLRESKLVVRDPDLNAYVRSVLCREVGADRCQAVRIYIVRTPHFNASMAPNGMLQLWTGVFVRILSEAELAAILGHEFAHFERQHSLKQFRDLRAKTDAMAWLSFLPYGVGLIGQIGLIGGALDFSRDQEREADLVSLEYLAASQYSPDSAANIWENLRAEMDATAAARNVRSRKDKNGGFFATHPGSAERASYLRERSAQLALDNGFDGAAEYRAALGRWWPTFFDDQIKLNDFGGTEFLLGALAGQGWSSDLLYARGELYRARGADGDFARAAQFYQQAIDRGDALPESWRGLGLAQLRLGDRAAGQASLRTYLELRPYAGDTAMIGMLAGGN